MNKVSIKVKVVSCILSIGMLISLAACAAPQSASPGGSPTKPPTEGSVPGASEETIKIGVLEDLSGDLASFGIPGKIGMELAVEEINAAGGVLGRSLQLIVTDTQSDTTLNQQMANKLIYEDNVDIIMGCVSSAAREAVRPIIDEAQTLFFYTEGYEDGVADHYTFCPSGGIDGPYILTPLIEELAKDYDNCKIYCVLPDYNFGQIISSVVKETAQEIGAEIVGMEFVPLGVSQFSSTIANIVAADPDIMVVVPIGTPQTAFYEQWSTEGKAGVPIVSCSACASTYEHKVFSPPVMEDVYIAAPYIEELDTPAAIEFTNKIKPLLEAQGIPYCNKQSEYGYTSVYMYANAVEYAGTTETEAVITALESGQITFDSPGGEVVMRGENHHSTRDMTMFRCDENNELQKIGTIDSVYSPFIEDQIRKEFEVDGGLAGLAEAGIDAPNVQYVPNLS